MKLLIRKNEKLILSVPLTKSKPLMLGRSPGCDHTITEAYISSVNFLIEWFGEDKSGYFRVFDVSHFRSKTQASAHKSNGIRLLPKGTLINGLLFTIEEEVEQKPKTEPQMKEELTPVGGIREHLREKVEVSNLGIRGDVIEVVSVRTDSDSVTGVHHFRKVSGSGIRPLKDFKELKFQKITPDHYQLEFKKATDAIAFSREKKIEGSKVSFGPADIIRIRWQLDDYFIRLVPDMETTKVRPQLLNDKVFRTLMVALGLFFLSLFFLPKPERVIDPAHIPRVVKITVPPNPEPIEPKKDVHPDPELSPIPLAEVKQNKTIQPINRLPLRKKITAAKKTVSIPTQQSTQQSTQQTTQKPIQRQTRASESKPMERPNTIVKPKEPQSYGLLGATSSMKEKTLKADDIIQNTSRAESTERPGEILSGSIGRKAPNGIYGGRNNSIQENGDGHSLADASSGVKGGMQFSSGGIKVDGGQFSIGDGTNENSDQEINGGLDRSSVKKSLQSTKNDIKNCFENALLTSGNLKGKIVFQWIINANGTVKSIKLLRSQVQSQKLILCVQNTIQNVIFEKANAPTVVIYPFLFQALR